MAAFEFQDDRSVAISTNGLDWRKLVVGLPPFEYDAGLVVGTKGVLLLGANDDTDAQGVEVLHAGVRFLRGVP